jgi:hypothetical protein
MVTNMRSLFFAALLAFPVAAYAQEPSPQIFPLPAPMFQHVIVFLQQGGTHAEGQALAEQLIDLARQQMAAQAKPAEPPATLPASPAKPTEPKAKQP